MFLGLSRPVKVDKGSHGLLELLMNRVRGRAEISVGMRIRLACDLATVVRITDVSIGRFCVRFLVCVKHAWCRFVGARGTRINAIVTPYSGFTAGVLSLRAMVLRHSRRGDYAWDTDTQVQKAETPSSPPPKVPSRGTIPIYRRGYGVARARGMVPRPLVWEDGRLRQIGLEDDACGLPFPGAVLGRSTGSLPSAPHVDVDEFGSNVQRGRGRVCRPRGRIKVHPSKPIRQWDENVPSYRLPEISSALPSPRKRPILPIDMSLPVFTLPTDVPLPSNDVLFPALECDQSAIDKTGQRCRKMKSSGVNDFDFETLKTYRRLNGYTLFTLVMKKKYGVVNDDNGQDQKSQNRRWQALWSTLPERDKQHWRARARKTQRQVESAPEKFVAAEAKRGNEMRKAEAQLARTETTKYNLLDIAAHFKLLSDSFANAAALMGEYRGPVAMEEVTSTLLDGLLTCLIPLVAIAGELEPLAGAPDKSTICTGLSSLAHIFPNF
ncbi:unnamed protein product [Mesocestoides corti]|uniref:HMG box domain-containing protein n=1 Tax=Mesocestoides corti TaxID=53468 RepID=A0A158QTG7_MESCO|nr:unnamed protein product [Mesocestoides corti]